MGNTSGSGHRQQKSSRGNATGRPATNAVRLRSWARSRRGRGLGFGLGAEGVGEGWLFGPVESVRVNRRVGFLSWNRRSGGRHNIGFLFAGPEKRGTSQNAD